MEIKQLECFVACAQTGSFTKAADILFMNQSNVSRTVRNLEKELNTKLFIRNNKGIYLTLEGERIYQKSRQILTTLKHLGKNVNPVQDTFTITTFPSNYVSYVFTKLCVMNTGKPVMLRLLSEGTSKIISEVENHTADIGFIYSSEKQKKRLKHILDKRQLQFFPVCHARPAVYIGKQNPILKERQPDIEDLKDLQFFKVDHDYRENYHDLIHTVEYYNLEKNLREAFIVDDGYGMTQMLNHSCFAYLGHVWMNADENAVIRNDQDHTIFDNPILLDSKDGAISMGYIVRKNEEKSIYCQEFCKLLHDIFLTDYAFHA
ncbi:MAG: LysR family transcriptional regulator [Lachnospiraceae bacterium]|nr:LysR family transcriptional regulator [Lachnospiraceae bacterium]